MKTSAGFDLLAALAVLSLNGAAGEKKNVHPVVKIGEMGTAEGTYGHTAWTNRKYQKFIDIPYGSTSYEGRFLVCCALRFYCLYTRYPYLPADRYWSEKI